MSRYLGIDYGTKRVGLAISDVSGGIASPLTVLDRAKDIDAQVRGVIESGVDYDVESYVLGIPFNMDGSEGEQAKLTRRFGQRLAAISQQVVHEWDERLSSRGADIFLSQSGMTYKKRKARRDAVAAQIILQGFLDAQPK